MDKHDKNLYYLHELSDYTIDDGYPDVRGWKVHDKSQRVIGTVDNLLVNKSTERVVYLDVEVDTSIIEANHQPYSRSAKDGVHDFLNKDGENHLIIPIGMVTLDEDSETVYTDKIDHRTFAETKRKTKDSPINRQYEESVLGSYNRDVDYTDEDSEFYDRGEFRRNMDADL
jgi:hypothetical protein